MQNVIDRLIPSQGTVTGFNEFVMKFNSEQKELNTFKTGDKVIIVSGLTIGDEKYKNIVGEYEFTRDDGMGYVAVKAKGQRKARSFCMHRDNIKLA